MKLFINLIYKINFKSDFYKLLNLLNYNKHLFIKQICNLIIKIIKIKINKCNIVIQ